MVLRSALRMKCNVKGEKEKNSVINYSKLTLKVFLWSLSWFFLFAKSALNIIFMRFANILEKIAKVAGIFNSIE